MTTEENQNLQTSPKLRNTHVKRWLSPVIFALAAAGALGFGIHNGIQARTAASAELAHNTEQAATPIVRVVHPQLAAPVQEIVLPGNTQAFTDSPIYARTSGYLARWYFDIGARVRKGDLLAEIETPEVDQQLQQAQAQLVTANANYDLAKTTADRWQFLLKSNSVSKQETDQAVANMNAQKATVDSNAANVRRLEQLQSFEKVYAPFDGVITARSTDIGALIDAGSAAQSKELFHLASIATLRVFVPVPEVYSHAARPGATATLTLDEYPGRVFHGRLARNSSAIDPSSRTLLAEVDVDNPEGLLLPGAYISVHLKLPLTIRSVTIPANTLLFRREGLRVGVVHGSRADLVPVTIGRDYGANVEIVSGLRASDSIILDPSDSLESGAPIRLAAKEAE
ncbi:MAG TPA: efflux RND transporter periplasmic adaptor subunit [Bryobacteraceae bacterium]|nr:efflux RND transporter periplasmic adaptor subunit [Bryobacteraceae bacterium]